jgi:hypothetical protein
VVGAAIAIKASVPNTAAEAGIIFESVFIFFPFLNSVGRAEPAVLRGT